MMKLTHAEKADLWYCISVLFMVVCVVLVFNQFTPAAVEAMVRTRLPLWVLGSNMGLMILSAANGFRHARKAKMEF